MVSVEHSISGIMASVDHSGTLDSVNHSGIMVSVDHSGTLDSVDHSEKQHQ